MGCSKSYNMRMKLREYMNLDGVQPTKLAHELGVAPAYLYQMATGIRPVSAERAIEIEKVTGGLVTCEDLRPDVDWGYLRGTACKPTRAEAQQPAVPIDIEPGQAGRGV